MIDVGGGVFLQGFLFISIHVFRVYYNVSMDTIYDLLVIGGGFGGVRLAQGAAKAGLSVCLITDKSYFEYYPAIYRIVIGAEPSTVTIPLADMRYADRVTCIVDPVTAIHLVTKSVTCASGNIYAGKKLCIALGVTNSYFGIPGMEEHSFGFKSISKAHHLHDRVKELFARHHNSDIDEQLMAFHFVIAGGGVSGVELAGELIDHARALAESYKIPASRVSVTIVESNPTVVPTLPPRAQRAITRKLENKGVRILCNRKVVESKAWTVTLSDMTIAAKTVIWAAGVASHPLLTATPALPLSLKKKIIVDEYLGVQGFDGVFALGDCADTQFSGLAQTADKQGVYLAKQINADNKMHHQKTAFVQKSIAYVVPIGFGFGVFVYNTIVIAGVLPWLLRFVIDMKFYFSLLPFRHALKIVRDMMRKK